MIYVVVNRKPSLLFMELLELCKKFNKDYETKSSKENNSLYSQYFCDIRFSLEKLGLYFIKKL